MNTRRARYWILSWMILVVTFGLILSAGYSGASIITWDLQSEYSEATPPAGPPPWLTAIIDDEADPGNITLALISNLIDSEFVNMWLFNYDTDNFLLTPDDFVYNTSSTGPEPIVQIGDNAYSVPGDGCFDIRFDFGNSYPGDRFGPFEEVVFTITKPGLTACSFNFTSDLSKDGYEYGLLTAAHVGGIGPTGDESGWITYNPETSLIIHNPEPSTIFLLLFGLIGIIGIRKKIRSYK